MDTTKASDLLNATDIRRMPDDLKDLVFAFDTERSRFHSSMIRGMVMPLMMIGMGVMAYLLLLTFEPVAGYEWVRTAAAWAGVAGIVFAVVTAPFMMGNAFGHLRDSRKLASILRAKGIDPSKITSDAVWCGLFDENPVTTKKV